MWNRLQTPLALFLLGDAIARLEPLVNRIHATWAMFIRTGNPETAAIADWPRYELTHRTTMLLNEVSLVVDDPQAEILPVWDSVS